MSGKNKIEMCENFIKEIFRKHIHESGGICTESFWNMAEKSGLWERDTYGTPMTIALEKLTTLEAVSDENGKFLYRIFCLA